MASKGIKNRLLTLAMLSIGFSAWASATDQTHSGPASPKGLSAAYLACQQQARGAVEQAACISQEQSLQDKRLNRVYKQLMAALNADGKAKLVDAQRAWLQSRTKDGNLEAAIYGNTQAENLDGGEAALFRLCVRADQLEKYLRLIN